MLEFLLFDSIWEKLLLFTAPAVPALIGVFIMLCFNRKALEDTNNHNERLLQLKLKEVEKTYETKLLEVETSIGRVALPRALEALQEAFYHLRRINRTLYSVHGSVDSDLTDLDTILKGYNPQNSRQLV
jgi:replicative DNA helicase